MKLKIIQKFKKCLERLLKQIYFKLSSYKASLDPSNPKGVNNLFYTMVMGILFLVIGYATFLLIVSWPIARFSIDAAGTFGDSFGPLTATFSGLAFAGLIWTVLLQKEELKLQRMELSETRKQAVLTRMMTVTQNQISTFRSELNTLKFFKVDSKDLVGFVEMLHDVSSAFESCFSLEPNQNVDSELTTRTLINLVDSISKNRNSNHTMMEGLLTRCKSNRLMLSNKEITCEEAEEVKNMFFSELPTGLIVLCKYLKPTLETYYPKLYNARIGGEPSFMDPLTSLVRTSNMIIDYYELNFTDEDREATRKNRYIYNV